MLELFYINFVNNIVSSYRELLTTDFFEKMFGILPSDKEEAFLKFAQEARKYEKNPMGFFEFEAKKLNRISSEMFKK